MLRTQIAAAIGCARGSAIDEIMRKVWGAYASGQLTEDEAGQLSMLAHERKARGSGQTALSLVFPPPAERRLMPVRRCSYCRGRSEGQIWRPTNRRQVREIVLAARRYELAEKQFGKRVGPLGSVGIEVLELFANVVDFRSGRLDPSIDWIMSKLRRSRAAVVAALKALRTHGFLDWLRRYEPTGRDGRGPQVKQASNAYRMSLPERARKLLGSYFKAPPPPDDYSAAEEAQAVEMDVYRKALPLDELALLDAGNGPLGQALARLGKSLQERESAKQTESLSHLYLRGET